MDRIMEATANRLCEELFEIGKNHILLYGKPERTREVLRAVYERGKAREELLCSWHDASVITQPMDFFEPILRLKYGSDYEAIREDLHVKDFAGRNDKGGVFQLAALCGREDTSRYPNARRQPVIFIDGIEELFFKLDYGHLDEAGLKDVLAGRFMKRPLSKGFGDCLRGFLHQTGKGIFYGTVRDTAGTPFATTIGNYDYLFYGENFMPVRVQDEHAR